MHSHHHHPQQEQHRRRLLRCRHCHCLKRLWKTCEQRRHVLITIRFNDTSSKTLVLLYRVHLLWFWFLAIKYFIADYRRICLFIYLLLFWMKRGITFTTTIIKINQTNKQTNKTIDSMHENRTIRIDLYIIFILRL